MKNMIIAVLIGFTVFTPASHFSLSAAPTVKTVVYYFHGQFRCYSCTRIEELASIALQKHFSKELASGAVVWRPVNVDAPGNERYIADYRLRTRSVVASRVIDGKEISWKNLERVWHYYNDEPAFTAYIKSEIDALMR